MGLDGSFDELDAAIAHLEQLDGAVARAAAVAAPELAAVAHTQWASGTAPDGSRWPPNKRGPGVPLAALTARITFEASGSSITATGPDELVFHQRTRPVFPEGDDLPPAWRAPLEDAVRAQIEDPRAGTV